MRCPVLTAMVLGKRGDRKGAEQLTAQITCLLYVEGGCQYNTNP